MQFYYPWLYVTVISLSSRVLAASGRHKVSRRSVPQSTAADDPAKTKMTTRDDPMLVHAHRAAQLANSSIIPPSLLQACTNYTIKFSGNANLTCANGLLARSGVEYLRSFIPDTSNKAGFAPLRVLDSFSLTDGPEACQYTDDGRHFYEHDLMQLRAMAEGVLAVLGSSSKVSDAAWKKRYVDGGVFLTPIENAREYASTMEIPRDYDKLLRLAFKDRHIIFIGDSTTASMHHQLAAWLLASTSQNPVDQLIKREILGGNLTHSAAALHALKLECPQKPQIFTKDFLGGRCSYAATTFCKNGCTPTQLIKEETFQSILSFAAGHGSLYPLDDSYALKKLVTAEHQANSILDRNRNPAASLSKKNIVVVSGGLHYFHLFPSRGFEGKLGALLGDYQSKVKKSLDILRAHVGPAGLIIWKTAGNVCDSKYTGEYELALSRLKLAIEGKTSLPPRILV